MIALTHASTYPEVIRFLEAAKNDTDLTLRIAEVRRQGSRVFGEDFTITYDKVSLASDIRARVSFYVPDWDMQVQD